MGPEYQIVDVPADMVDRVAEYTEKLKEAAADFDEDVMEKYLEGEEIAADDIKEAIRKGAISLDITPVFLRYGPLRTKAYSFCSTL